MRISPQATPPSAPGAEKAQQALGAITIVPVRRGDDHGDQLSSRVDKPMPLAPVALLRALEAFGATTVRGFDRWRVENRHTGLAVAAFERTEGSPEGVMETFPEAAASPLPGGVETIP